METGEEDLLTGLTLLHFVTFRKDLGIYERIFSEENSDVTVNVQLKNINILLSLMFCRYLLFTTGFRFKMSIISPRSILNIFLPCMRCLRQNNMILEALKMK